MRQIQLTEWGDESVLHEANVPIPTPVRGIWRMVVTVYLRWCGVVVLV